VNPLGALGRAGARSLGGVGRVRWSVQDQVQFRHAQESPRVWGKPLAIRMGTLMPGGPAEEGGLKGKVYDPFGGTKVKGVRESASHKKRRDKEGGGDEPGPRRFRNRRSDLLGLRKKRCSCNRHCQIGGALHARLEKTSGEAQLKGKENKKPKGKFAPCAFQGDSSYPKRLAECRWESSKADRRPELPYSRN